MVDTTKYNRENYYSVTLRLPKESKEVLQALAAQERRSMTNLFVYALEQQYNVKLSKK
jgi:predicted transcriptional regulator